MAIYFSSWLNYINNLLYRGVGSIPDPAKFRLCLSTGAGISRSSNKATVICTELPLQFGSDRKSIVYSTASSFYNTEFRDRFDPVTATWTASGGTLQFSSLFLLANANPVANASCAISNSKIIATNHGLISGDEVCFSSISGAFPTEIQSNTLYKVLNPTVNDFEIATIAAPSTPITISTASGTYRLHYATGQIVEFHIEDSPRTRQSGLSYSVEMERAIGGMTYGNGI